MTTFDRNECPAETLDEGAQRFVEKIIYANDLAPEDASLSTTERILVAFALCDRQYLPTWLQLSPAKYLWTWLDDKQKRAIALWAEFPMDMHG